LRKYERIRRDLAIEESWLRGEQPVAIGINLKLPQRIVRSALGRFQAEYATYDKKTLTARRRRQAEWVMREAASAWERSKQDETKMKQETIKSLLNPDDATKGATKVTVEKKTSPGDPRFLQEYRAALALLAKIEGLVDGAVFISGDVNIDQSQKTVRLAMGEEISPQFLENLKRIGPGRNGKTTDLSPDDVKVTE